MGNNPAKPEGGETVNIIAGHLDLGFRKLQELPPTLLAARPSDLTSIDLSHNIFSSVSGIELLHQLEKIDLSHNEISSIEVWIISLSNLECMNISHNAIVSMPSGVHKLEKLKELRISHNLLTGIAELTSLENLTTIDVSFNAIERLPKDIDKLVCSIGRK